LPRTPAENHVAQRLAQIERQIIAIDAALKAGLAQEPGLKVRFDMLISTPKNGAACDDRIGRKTSSIRSRSLRNPDRDHPGTLIVITQEP